ncbi:TolC family protein [Sandaracinus amylolyticus]|uniref:TolC family protein n=1 Tax=Sandaracinus amylolyticus TaxID=927083 RepID=UPI001F2F85EA|nr:TolC family protein [Sandaracinus amylolyticus]UJR83648.1 Hypothetical protein I5071_57170 [Sandaracinus amylolyticus]
MKDAKSGSMDRRARAPRGTPGDIGRYLIAVICAALLACASDIARAQVPTVRRVVIVSESRSSRIAAIEEGLHTELLAATSAEELVEIVEVTPELDGDYDSVRRALRTALEMPADVVVANGPLAAHAAAEAGASRRTLVLPVVLSPEVHGLLSDGLRSGARGIAYLSGGLTLERDLERVATALPDGPLGVAIDAELVAHAPALAGVIEGVAQRVGRELVVVAVPRRGAIWLPEGIRALHAAGLYGLDAPQERALLDAALDRGVAVVGTSSMAGAGALATLDPPDIERLRGRAAALHVRAILEGRPAGELTTVFEPSERLTIDREIARRIGVGVPFALTLEGTVLHPRSSGGAGVGLEDAVERAIAANFALQSSRLGVEIGQREVERARAALLPQARVGARADLIDADRAAGPGPPAERQLSWEVVASQVLYAEDAWATFDGAGAVQDARRHDIQRAEIDLVLAVAVAYVDVLRASTVERVERENLERVHGNLAVAELRRRAGVAGADEVHRWRIEVAEGRRRVVAAVALRNRVEIELNRLLARDLEEPLALRDDDLESLPMMAADDRLADVLGEPQRFASLRRLLAAEAIDNAPDLAAYDDRIRAARRRHAGAQRRLWVPTTTLVAGLTHRFATDGAGSGQGEPLPFTVPDALDWSVGLVVSLPLLEGGAMVSEIEQASLEIARLERERTAAAQMIEADVRAALHAAGASFASIALTVDAATAASAGLELVREAYARGAIDVIRVVDAQTQARVSALRAADARFEFVRDFLAVEHATREFSIGSTTEQRTDFFRRLSAAQSAAERPR